MHVEAVRAEGRSEAVAAAVAALAVVVICFGFAFVGATHSGSFGIARRPLGPSSEVVTAVAQQHKSVAGVRAGDVIRLDRLTPHERLAWKFPREGQRIELPVERASRRMRVDVTASGPGARQLPTGKDLQAASCSLLYALLAVLIAATAPKTPAVRPILAFILGTALNAALMRGGTRIVPSSDAAAVAYVFAQLAIVLVIYGQLAFPLSFPSRRTPGRRLIGRLGIVIAPAFALAWLIGSAGVVLGLPQWAWLDRSYDLCGLMFETLCACAVVESIWCGGREARAQTVSAGSTLLLLASYFGMVDVCELLGWDTTWAYDLGVVPYLAGLGMTYAVLRHRLVELQLVVSRAAIFSAVSLVLLCAFLLGEWAVALILEHAVGERVAEGTRSIVAGSIALVVGLSARSVHEVVAHRLNRLFFAKRFRALEELHRFALETDAATEAGALVGLTGRALERHLDATYLALYAGDTDTGYLLLFAAGDAPSVLEPNDEIVLRLRRWHEAFVNGKEPQTFPGAFVCPMTLRGTLHGFLVCGPKRDRTAYLPDERDVLVMLAHRVGVAYEWLTRGGISHKQTTPLARLPSF